jgi:hypothetical protein
MADIEKITYSDNAELVTVERVDLGQINLENWSEMAMIRKAWKRIFERATTNKELQYQQGQSYCRTKKKLHTDKTIFTFYSMEYISPKFIKAKNYTLFRQHFYMLHSS